MYNVLIINIAGNVDYDTPSKVKAFLLADIRMREDETLAVSITLKDGNGTKIIKSFHKGWVQNQLPRKGV